MICMLVIELYAHNEDARRLFLKSLRKSGTNNILYTSYLSVF